ncbi:Pentatricopeptide repeat-containing protein, chloroplastic [Ananas comosus]|uniref:Pentatricopeptide repeat-containing protein, chloroplastic n=1 Tax=Ananas comosus TaxID=4615 RepID=A0A199UV86_ANACO|nr:Pentatricopeptide repeat-containing protein, chloroplastic [Ananas comosus]
MHMLMVSYGTAGQPQEAENVLNNLKTSGLELSSLPYSSVIDAYLKNGDYNLGIAKLLEMKGDGLELDHRIWTCFIRAASLCEQTNQAVMLLNALGNTGFDLPIRTAEYNMVSLSNTLKHTLEMGSPFLPCKTRTGVLVAKAHSLRMWLKDSSSALT